MKLFLPLTALALLPGLRAPAASAPKFLSPTIPWTASLTQAVLRPVTRAAAQGLTRALQQTAERAIRASA